MIDLWWTLGVLTLVLVLVLSYWAYASRLDRLHRKVEAAKIGLEAQLVTRSSVALDIALSGQLDPASSLALAQACNAVQEEREVCSAGLTGVDSVARLSGLLTAERTSLESALSEILREIFTLPGDDAAEEAAEVNLGVDQGQVDLLAGAWYRVQLARRFHNEAVAQTQAVRSKWFVRVLRMAGRAPRPLAVDFDDVSPQTLIGRAPSAPPKSN